MKKSLIGLVGLFLFISCSSEDTKRVEENNVNKNNNLELKVSNKQMKSEELRIPLEELYSNLFAEIDSKLKKNKEIISVEFIVALDKTSGILYVEKLDYFNIEDFATAFATAYLEGKEGSYITHDVDATCSGGILDGRRDTFKENMSGMKKLARWTEECLNGGGCVSICRASLSIKFNE